MNSQFEIIPAIDLIEGKCVRLSQGDFARKTVYSDDPAEVARRFEAAGLRRLHLVDLDGARSGRVTNLRVLAKIAAATGLTIDFSGGIKTDADIRSVFDAGAAIAAVGSVAVRQPELFIRWLEEFGGERILLGADVRNEKLAVDGWQTETETGIFDFLRGFAAKGVTQAFVTDISKDGLLEGPATALYRRILDEVPGLRLTASGGVSKREDLDDLKQAGCSGAIVGKAFYEGKITLEELCSA
jgi:phosphoribosylformimino-5-aminoimidazole carboxamide ribotide isomerase